MAGSIKVLHINSLSQKIEDKNKVVFEGNVEVVIDSRLHLWADYVLIDKKKQELFAESRDSSSVCIEDENFLVLADCFQFDFKKKTGYANNIRFHVDEGYFFAGRAEKVSETVWCLKDMLYTACDSDRPHWCICANRAKIHGSYFVRASGIVFKMGGVPVVGLPSFVFPIQGRSKSGFLIPRFSFDYDYGFGVKQEYYKYLTPHCDTTIGFDWRDRKGLVFSDEFRWVRSPESYTMINSHYAIFRDRFKHKDDKIVKATEKRYWISGKDFWTFSPMLKDVDVYSLLRMDFGTDKRIGYHFFNNTDSVDDAFNNSFYLRSYWQDNLISMILEHTKMSRKWFDVLKDDEKEYFLKPGKRLDSLFAVREFEDRVNLSYLPHVEWNMPFKSLKNLFYYRHDLFFDHALYRQRGLERVYLNSILESEGVFIPQSKADLIRFCYKGYLTEDFSIARNAFSFSIKPTFQLASRLAKDLKVSKNVLERKCFAHGGYKFFLEYGAEWALPEGCVHATDGSDYECMVQPIFTWNFTPKIYQEHWYHFDMRDRAYPKNQLSFLLRNYLNINDVQFDFELGQGYDFYSKSDIFPLRRGTKQRHLLPLHFNLGVDYQNVHFGLSQEYEWGSFALLQSEVQLALSVKRVQLAISYLFQKKELQRQRQLLSRIPHFIGVNLAIPIGRRASVIYDGQFYAAQRSSIFFFDKITPLIHQIRFEYNGHCWGFYVGLEEKKYKEYGIGRNERAIVFAFRLDSLGSFAKRFKRVMQLERT